jgi:cellulose synthase/poly-beta-1,6-N-acetylglucosamine synthase-like glycosyltransferase
MYILSVKGYLYYLFIYLFYFDVSLTSLLCRKALFCFSACTNQSWGGGGGGVIFNFKNKPKTV